MVPKKTSKKHAPTNSNYQANHSSSPGTTATATMNNNINNKNHETPRGGEKKKKMRQTISAFGDSFSNPDMFQSLFMLHTNNDEEQDGWRKVQAKDKPATAPPSPARGGGIRHGHQRAPNVVPVEDSSHITNTNSRKNAKAASAGPAPVVRTSTNITTSTSSSSRKPLRPTFSGISEEDLQANRPTRGPPHRSNTTTTTTTTTTRTTMMMMMAPPPVMMHTAAFYSQQEIQELIRRLVESSNCDEALEAMGAIRAVLKDDNDTTGIITSSPAKKADAAHQLFHCQLLPALLLKLQKYGPESALLTEMVARILVQMTYFEPSSQQVMVQMGGVQALFEAAQYFPGDLYVSGNVIVLFSNLALDPTTRHAVQTNNPSAYIDYVLSHMRAFPQEPYTQRVGCKYLANIMMRINDNDDDNNDDDDDNNTKEKTNSTVMELLFEKSAMPVVAMALQNHRKSDIGVRNVAKEVMQMFLDYCGDDDDDNNHDDDDNHVDDDDDDQMKD